MGDLRLDIGDSGYRLSGERSEELCAFLGLFIGTGDPPRPSPRLWRAGIVAWAVRDGETVHKEGRYPIAFDHGGAMGSAWLDSLAIHGLGGLIPPLLGGGRRRFGDASSIHDLRSTISSTGTSTECGLGDCSYWLSIIGGEERALHGALAGYWLAELPTSLKLRRPGGLSVPGCGDPCQQAGCGKAAAGCSSPWEDLRSSIGEPAELVFAVIGYQASVASESLGRKYPIMLRLGSRTHHWTWVLSMSFEPLKSSPPSEKGARTV